MDFPVRIDPLSGYNDSASLAMPDPGITRNPPFMGFESALIIG